MGTRQKFQIIAVCGLLLVGLGCQPPGARAMFEGEARLKAGEPKLAIAQFEKAVKLLPGEWRAWNYLAWRATGRAIWMELMKRFNGRWKWPVNGGTPRRTPRLF